jgi:hypothetical protein
LSSADADNTFGVNIFDAHADLKCPSLTVAFAAPTRFMLLARRNKANYR